MHNAPADAVHHLLAIEAWEEAASLIESMALRQSTRNELMTSLLARCPVENPTGAVGRQYYMEKRGEGVPIILEESKRVSGRDPAYRLIDDAELLLGEGVNGEPRNQAQEQ